MNPFFSIIMPTYNRASMISKAIDSVLSQDFYEWELIIIDDCSPDNTGDIVKKYTDIRIKYFRNEKNLEKSGARNRGIELAKGEFICFLDDDDIYLESFLTDFYNKIKETKFEPAMYYCECWYENETGKRWAPEEGEIDAENNIELVAQKTIASQRACLHKEILEKHKYDPKNYRTEDLDLWARVLQEYPLYATNTRTYVFFVHGERSVDLTNFHTWNYRYNYIKWFAYEGFKNDLRKKIADKIFGYATLSMARHYDLVKNKKKAVLYSLKALMTDHGAFTKEKYYILAKNCILTSWLPKFKQS